MRWSSIATVMSAVATLGQCARASAQDRSRDAGEKRTATLERTMCMGGCAAYSVTVTDQGHVRFTYAGRMLPVATDSLRPGDVRVYSVDPRQAAALFHEIDSLGFFSIPEDWTGDDPTHCPTAYTDAPMATVTVVEPMRRHVIRHYDGCSAAPAELSTIENSIDRVVDVWRWIGNRPPPGPAIR